MFPTERGLLSMKRNDIVVVVWLVAIGALFGIISYIVKSTIAKWILGIISVLVMCFTIYAVIDAIFHNIFGSRIQEKKRINAIRNVIKSEASDHSWSKDHIEQILSSVLSMQDELRWKSYNMLDRFDAVDFNFMLSTGPSKAYGRCRLLAENEVYLFYEFTPKLEFGISYIVLRVTKNDTADVRYFGKSNKLTCILGDYLFHADHRTSWAGCFVSKNIETGIVRDHYWFRMPKSTNGHFSKFDYINRMYVKNNQLILDVGRYNGDFNNRDDSYRYETDYKLIVEIVNGEPVPLNTQPWEV